FNTDPTRIEVIRAGNPDLVPEKRWLWDAVYEYRLPADQGVLSAHIYYLDISDYIDQVPVDQSTVSATGNISKGKDYAAELTANLRLGFIGLPTATLDLTLQRRDTEVID